MEMDSINKHWDEYAEKSKSITPSEHLVRFIATQKLQYKEGGFKVLEIGCGGGRNSLYLASLGFDITINDISHIAIGKTQELLTSYGYDVKSLIGNVLTCDLDFYDLIVDISALQHLRNQDLPVAIELLHAHLVPGGSFFSITKSRADSIFGIGEYISDSERYFPAGVPKVWYETFINFVDEKMLRELYSCFGDVEINSEEWSYDRMKYKNAHWLVSAIKKS
jgi:cyclopropane fatty-acyl-phospholipid synthase-like methyltransferase